MSWFLYHWFFFGGGGVELGFKKVGGMLLNHVTSLYCVFSHNFRYLPFSFPDR